jgi:hypothetical protein
MMGVIPSRGLPQTTGFPYDSTIRKLKDFLGGSRY